MATLFLGLFGAGRLQARTLVVGDFNRGSDPLNIDSTSNLFTTDPTIVTGTYVAHSGTEPAHGNQGFSLRLNHLNASDGFFLIQFSQADLRGFRSLTFWVRGASGGENFKLDLRQQGGAEPGYRPSLRDFVPGGVTKQWQKVNIPFKAIFQDFLGANYEPLSNINAIVLNFTGGLPVETVYIDDLEFHSKSGNVVVDTFDDGSDPDPYNRNPGAFIGGGSGAGISDSYETANAFSSSDLKVVWSTGTSLPTAAAFLLEISSRQFASPDQIGIDLSGCDKLSFHVKNDPASSGQALGAGLSDSFGHEVIDASTVTLTTFDQRFQFSLSDFSGMNLSSASVFELWFINNTPSNGPPIGNNKGTTFYLDEVRFLDSSAPRAPGNFLKSGLALANGGVFASTDVLAVTADNDAADATMERVRFEQDGLSGGASWYVLGVATDTSSGSYQTLWNNFAALTPGNTYQVRTVAEDVAGNESALAFTGLTAPLVNSATGFVGAPQTSTIVWSWFLNNAANEDGYRVFSDTGGQMSPDLAFGATFWAETGLTPNTRYGRAVAPFKGGVAYAATATQARFTLAVPVATVTVTGTSNNSLTIAWSTAAGAAGQFVVQRASDVSGAPGTFVVLATAAPNTLSFQDTGLSANTTYWYRVSVLNGELVPSAAVQVRAVTNSTPQVDHVPLGAIGILGKDASINVSVSAVRPLQSVTLFYRKKGTSPFTSLGFSPAPSGASLTYSGSAKIPDAFVRDSLSVQGFEYEVVAADTLQVGTSPASGLNSVLVSQSVTFAALGASGGTLTLGDGDPADSGTSVTFPSGALASDTAFTIRQADPASVPALNGQAPAAVYEFSPSGLTFSRSVTMSLFFFDQDGDGIVDGTAIDKRLLKFFWYDGFAWRNLGGSLDARANTVSADVSHFSLFALFPAGDPTADEMRPKEKIITPNGDGKNDFAQFGVSGDFEIKIFDAGARPVRTLKGVSVWDGRKDDGNIVESGIYLYQIKTARLNVSGTIGVAR